MESNNIDERLQTIRHEIDAVDKELLRILNKRALLSLEVGRIKKNDSGTIFKPSREVAVLEGLELENNGPLPNTHIRSIWREIFSSSRALQRPQRVAYLGPEGTFSYFAGMEYLGQSVDFQAYSNFHDIFSSVNAGTCELGVVPLENSLQGTVGQCFDLFYNFNVTIQAELFLRISHGLLSKAIDLTKIKRVYSHSQPLTQCANWLRMNLPMAELIPMQSTAAAATKATNDEESAAIGHVSLGSMLGLNVLASAIENSADNWTRFVIISKKEHNLTLPATSHTGEHKKTSLLFTLNDQPGSLSSILNTLAQNDINMRKLESRPLHLSSGECWRYVFFVDVEADLLQECHAGLLQNLRELCTSFRVLGSYLTVPPFSHTASSVQSTAIMGETC